MKERFSLLFFRSIGFKIAIIVFCVGTVPFMVFAPISLGAYEKVSIHTDATNLMAQAMQYTNLIVTSGYVAGEENDILDTEFKSIADSYNGRILIVTPNIKAV